MRRSGRRQVLFEELPRRELSLVSRVPQRRRVRVRGRLGTRCDTTLATRGSTVTAVKMKLQIKMTSRANQNEFEEEFELSRSPIFTRRRKV